MDHQQVPQRPQFKNGYFNLVYSKGASAFESVSEMA